MRLGFFDSGLGGTLVRNTFQKKFPHMSFLLQMDREHAPYGERSADEIRMFTEWGVGRLFRDGADVVILACNTASVHALRYLQTEVYPDKHILGVTIPGAEKIVENGYKHVGVMATQATVRIRGYSERVRILDTMLCLEEIGVSGLVDLIEKGILDGPEIETIIKKALRKFSPDIEALVLGCTHYPLVANTIEILWEDVHHTRVPDIINPAEEAAIKFGEWLIRKGYEERFH